MDTIYQITDTIVPSDTIISGKEIILLLNENSKGDQWNLLFFIVAIASIVIALIIPFLLKLYDQFKTKQAILIYLRSFIYKPSLVLHQEKTLYFKTDDKQDVIDVMEMSLLPKIQRFKNDFFKNKNTQEVFVALALLSNFNTISFQIYQLKEELKNIDKESISKTTISFGEKLSKKYLENVYGFLLLIERIDFLLKVPKEFIISEIMKKIFENSSLLTDVNSFNSEMIKHRDVIFEDFDKMKKYETQIFQLFNSIDELSLKIDKFGEKKS